MWRLNALARLMLPPGRTTKRFFAPLLVFILGMILPLSCGGRCFPMEKLDTHTPLFIGTFCYINPTVPLLSNQQLFNLPGFVFSPVFCPALETIPSPSAGLPSWETVRLHRSPPSQLLRAQSSACRFPDAPFHDHENAT